ncbi:imidazole glycerol phosphate synthase subunit HisF [Desulfovibrio psychrotolerans]|uniref:imidazole glycerol-phosphate synthase n=1 Tax=Desulfovibrio psychrotolerans TaxID=415242 RepID=A0A7J0BY63_9BACT|nr:imidazole glycerol phosphate synthase cyclase subunit [Desulfovibrio psychrotolerans]GFM38111.1 imidazole glycerol phosphate synthase cyclase subunit [Desulfovibrio psychrotolerans]
MSTTNPIRIIPRLDIKGPNLIKSIHLEGLRVLGKPEFFATKYCEQGADEIIYIDSVASLYGRNNLHEIVSRTASNISIPLTVGGGIRSLDDAYHLLRSGADKVAINTSLFEKPGLISEVAKRFGSQCVVVYIEAKKVDNRYRCMHTYGRDITSREPLEWAKEAVDRGAGEILLTSVDQEGTGNGYDLELIHMLASSLPVPVIASGGAGRLEHLLDAATTGMADAISLASMLHYDRLQNVVDSENYASEGNTSYIALQRGKSTEFLKQKIRPTSILDIKHFLLANNIQTRLI